MHIHIYWYNSTNADTEDSAGGTQSAPVSSRNRRMRRRRRRRRMRGSALLIPQVLLVYAP